MFNRRSRSSWGFSDELVIKKAEARRKAEAAEASAKKLRRVLVSPPKTPIGTPVNPQGPLPPPMPIPKQATDSYTGIVVNATREQCDMFDRLGVIPCEKV
jgi:hypothetical protein